MTTSSSDVADEENFFFPQTDKNDESEEQTIERQEQSRLNAKQWAANEEPSALKKSVKEITKIDGNTTFGIKANARIRVEQDVDLVLKNMELKILGQLTTDKKYKHYNTNKDRIMLKDNLVFCKHYGETGSVKYYQNLIQSN